MKAILLCLAISVVAVHRPLPKPKDLPPPPKVCRFLNGVPICVELGTFHTNPRWWEALHK